MNTTFLMIDSDHIQYSYSILCSQVTKRELDRCILETGTWRKEAGAAEDRAHSAELYAEGLHLEAGKYNDALTMIHELVEERDHLKNHVALLVTQVAALEKECRDLAGGLQRSSPGKGFKAGSKAANRARNRQHGEMLAERQKQREQQRAKVAENQQKLALMRRVTAEFVVRQGRRDDCASPLSSGDALRGGGAGGVVGGGAGGGAGGGVGGGGE